MSAELCPGDLVTGRRSAGEVSSGVAGRVGTMLARPAGSVYWTLRVPRSSIMTVVDISPATAAFALGEAGGWVTVLHNGQLIDLFNSSIERLQSVEQ